MWHFYVHRDKAIVPTVGCVSDGAYLDVEPVAIASSNDATALARAVTDAILRGNPHVQLPPRSSYGVPVAQRAAGAKSWGAFARAARTYEVYLRPSGYEFHVRASESGKGHDERTTPVATMPADSTVSDVARTLVMLSQKSGNAPS